MRARDVEGRTIVALHQSRFVDGQTGNVGYAVDSIELDNGDKIVFMPGQDDSGDWVTAFVVKGLR